MLEYQKYNTIASVLTAVITIIGVAAALAYYLSLNPDRTWFYFLTMFIIYFIIIIASIYVTGRRLEQNG